MVTGPCGDSTACPPALLRLVNTLAGNLASTLPRKFRSRKRGCGTRDSHKRWLNTDPCGLICASLTWVIVLYCSYATTFVVLGGWWGNTLWGWLHGLVFNFLASLSLASHARAMLSNPGATPLTSKPTTPAGWSRTCTKCDNHKPERAHHCSLCGRCIIKMDREFTSFFFLLYFILAGNTVHFTLTHHSSTTFPCTPFKTTAPG
jgi:hypothetical protein